MKKIIACILAIVLLNTALVSCTQKQPINSDSKERKNSDYTNRDLEKIEIVATIFPQYDFTRAIVGDRANLSMLISPGMETHSYEPSPADISKIQNSDVFIYIGGEDDKWVDTILDSMDIENKKIIKLMDYVKPVEEEIVEGMEAHAHGHHDDHEHDGDDHDEHEHDGDDHDEHDEHEHNEHDEHDHDHNEHHHYDEHIWTSPSNAIVMVDAIADVLCEVDSKNAAIYTQNAQKYIAELKKLIQEFKEVVDNAENKLMIFGDRFPLRYFVDEFGLDYRAAFSGCSIETEASAATIAYLVDTVVDNNMSHIFYIEMSNQDIARAISEHTGAEPLLFHSCHNVSKDDFESGATYVSLMNKNVDSLRKGLK